MWEKERNFVIYCSRLTQLIRRSILQLLYLKIPQQPKPKPCSALFRCCSPGFSLTPSKQTAWKRCLVLFCWLSFFPSFLSPPSFGEISAKTISFWQSEFVILSNHLGCLQNFNRWQRLVDKCFVIQVISFSATVAILINRTYDCICQDWKHCHIPGICSSELTTMFFVLWKGSILLCQHAYCSGANGGTDGAEREWTPRRLGACFVLAIQRFLFLKKSAPGKCKAIVSLCLLSLLISIRSSADQVGSSWNILSDFYQTMIIESLGWFIMYTYLQPLAIILWPVIWALSMDFLELSVSLHEPNPHFNLYNLCLGWVNCVGQLRFVSAETNLLFLQKLLLYQESSSATTPKLWVYRIKYTWIHWFQWYLF